MYVYTYTVLETRMSGYHLLFVFTFYLEVLAVASCQGGKVVVQPLGKVCIRFGKISITYTGGSPTPRHGEEAGIDGLYSWGET